MGTETLFYIQISMEINETNREICIIAHRAITERIALLDSGILLLKAYEGQNGDFSLLHGM